MSKAEAIDIGAQAQPLEATKDKKMSKRMARKMYRYENMIPNRKTRRTFKRTDAGKGLTRCKDAEDMFKRLGI